jgi:hypothetical protein
MRRAWWIIGYALLMFTVVVAMLKSREWTLARLSTPESIADWQKWRDDVDEKRVPGPVERRTPRSVEPPALVLMRDHFTVSIIGAIVFTTAFYWVSAWFITGVLAAKKT